MKKVLLVICMVCLFVIPLYSAIKDYSILNKSFEAIKLLRSSATSAETQIKIYESRLSNVVDLDAVKTDKTDITLLKAKITATLMALNDLISTIDTLYPDIK